jgi:type VI secretion system Hcp family effector
MMATNIYLKFTNYGNSAATIKGNVTASGYVGAIQATSLTWSVEQTLNIGSQSTGAGAGKVTFNDLTFTKAVDATSPAFFLALCAGIPFEFVDISFVTSAGTTATCRLKLAAVKSIDGTVGTVDGGTGTGVPSENIALEYGGVIWTVGAASEGWNRVQNTADTNPATAIN